MSRLRRSLVLGALTFLVAVLAALAVADPFFLRHSTWFGSGLVLLTLVLATATLVVAVKVRFAQILLLVVGGSLALGWAFIAWFSIDLDDAGEDTDEVVSGDQRLVVVQGAPFAIDPIYRVVLRSGSGMFEQESLVWQGLEEGSVPDEVAFRGVDEVTVRAGSCVYVSRVEAVTLAVEPVHRPQRPDRC